MALKVKPVRRFVNVRVLHLDDTANNAVVPIAVMTDEAGTALGTANNLLVTSARNIPIENLLSAIHSDLSDIKQLLGGALDG